LPGIRTTDTSAVKSYSAFFYTDLWRPNKYDVGGSRTKIIMNTNIWKSVRAALGDTAPHRVALWCIFLFFSIRTDRPLMRASRACKR